MAADPDALIPTRQSLLIRLKNWDDQDSWRDFFKTYWKLIYGVAVQAGLTDAEAQEVVQETVILVARKMPGFTYDPALGSFKNWLLHTTRWRIADQFRKRRRARGRAQTETARTATIERVADPAGFRLEAVWEAEWERNLVNAALEKVKRLVKPKQYQIFDLYVVKQWPVEKVARVLGINVGQIYMAKHRVGAMIKKEIKNLETRMV